VADIFLQSIGLISYLVPITYFFTGINILKQKKIFLLIENTFFIVIYSLLGSLFFSFFYTDSFNLYINGNGGFVGMYVSNSFLKNIINANEIIFYYLLIFFIILLFLISINFKLKNFMSLLKKILSFLFKNKTQNYTNKNEIISEYIPQDQIKSLIQEDLPFIKAGENQIIKKLKFIIPSIDLLKIPTKKERNNFTKNENSDPDFLEKILLDFGVNGTIKKVSHGPVVTLNEFEPAPGVKVSKIINLSDDIARNTSSESARIATIPGSSTVGIELPNLSRENVFLSEILNNTDFKKKEIKLPIAL
jgi:S-DNA-T family DNA segregation ATPase FtsK/SpoIIIE